MLTIYHLCFCFALFSCVGFPLFLFLLDLLLLELARLFLLAQDTHLMPFMKKPSVYVPIVTFPPV